MRDSCTPTKRVPSQYSLLRTVLTEQTVLVCPSPGSLFVSPMVRGQPQLPCPPSAIVRLLLSLLTRALTGSVAIGSVPQTR
jgi:hypothetical protein